MVTLFWFDNTLLNTEGQPILFHLVSSTMINCFQDDRVIVSWADEVASEFGDEEVVSSSDHVSSDEDATFNGSGEERDDALSVDSYEGLEEDDVYYARIEAKLVKEIDGEVDAELVDSAPKAKYPYACKNGVKCISVLKGECKFAHTPEMKPCKYGAECKDGKECKFFHETASEQAIGTTPCTKGNDCPFWKVGKCKFFHEKSYKPTTLCNKGKDCPLQKAGKCTFLHGEVKLTVPCNKGKDCIYLKAGTCPFLYKEEVKPKLPFNKGDDCPHFSRYSFIQGKMSITS